MTAVDSRRAAAVPVGSRPPRSARQAVAGYVALTKPRIIELLLVTTVPTMLLAEGGIPSLRLVAATLVGGALAAGSANTLNCYLDRDIDQVMHRTERRPLATGLVSPREALVFGLVLGAVSVGWLWLTTGWLPAVLALAAIAFYVGVYTMALKRRTPQNIVWGGAAGCMPVLIGWSAVTGSLAWTPVVLFGVIFFWTPPHYWPLSMRFRDDYAAAGVPMLPVVAGNVDRRPADRRLQLGDGGDLAAALAGRRHHAGLRRGRAGPRRRLPARGAPPAAPGPARGRRLPLTGTSVEAGAMRLFHGSITYLTLLFLAVAIDPLLPF